MPSCIVHSAQCRVCWAPAPLSSWPPGLLDFASLLGFCPCWAFRPCWAPAPVGLFAPPYGLWARWTSVSPVGFFKPLIGISACWTSCPFSLGCIPLFFLASVLCWT